MLVKSAKFSLQISSRLRDIKFAKTLATSVNWHSTLCPKERQTLSFSIFLPNINQFSKIFYWRILWTIGNKVIVKYLIKPQLFRYTTM